MTTQALDRSVGVLQQFEQALGGRQKISEALALDSTPEIQALVRLLLDPEFDDLSLAELAEQAKIGLTDLVRAYRNTTLARAQVLAVQQVAAKLPELAADVMKLALPTDVLCPLCKGDGKNRNKARTDEDCKACKGTGWVQRSASVQRQRLALELAELIRAPKGGTILINNTNNPPGDPGAPLPVGAGSLAILQQAMQQVVFGQRLTLPATAVREEEPRDQTPE